jgi:hypothetical protein
MHSLEGWVHAMGAPEGYEISLPDPSCQICHLTLVSISYVGFHIYSNAGRKLLRR